MSQRRRGHKVALMFDGMSALGPSPDLAILDSVEAIEQSLIALGHRVERVAVDTEARWVERMRKTRYDVAFNMCEGINGVSELELPSIGALELLGVPYTGANSLTTGLCLRKYLMNTIAERSGVPVPAWAVARAGEPVPAVGFPAICKPANEDASLGVEQRSVVRTARALQARLRDMHTLWDEIIVQRFVDGREVNVGIVGDEVLPLSEIDFDGMPSGYWRIVTYNAKWTPGSEEDAGTQPRCPADLSPELAGEIRRIARTAWRAVGGDGYGRVDLRIDAAGRPWLLEVNSNPDIAPDAGLARMARAAGMDYTALIGRVLDEAFKRKPLLQPERWSDAARLSGVKLDTADGDNALAAAGDR